MDYKGIIIEESLESLDALKGVRIVDTKVEKVTDAHKTPWLKQWTLHTVEIPEEKTDEVAQEISGALDFKHQGSWYADFKNDTTHVIVFPNKIFKVDRKKKEAYQEVVRYGVGIGIPEHQLDFSPDITEWER